MNVATHCNGLKCNEKKGKKIYKCGQSNNKLVWWEEEGVCATKQIFQNFGFQFLDKKKITTLTNPLKSTEQNKNRGKI